MKTKKKYLMLVFEENSDKSLEFTRTIRTVADFRISSMAIM